MASEQQATGSRMDTFALLPRVDTFALLLGAALVLLICWTTRDRFNDSDLWWHLRTGEVIARTHLIPLTDPFSFSAPGAHWVTQEWLSELIIFEAFHFGGNMGLAFWLALTASCLLVANYIHCRTYCGDARMAFLGGLLIWMLSTVGLAIRPHMLGYLMLTLEMAVLHAGFHRNARWLLALPPIFLCWVNLHSSFFLGLVVLTVFMASSLISRRIGLVEFPHWTPRQRNTLMLSGVLSLLVLLVNPIGMELLRFPFDVMFNQPLNSGTIIEWRPTILLSIRGVALIVASALVVLIPVCCRKPILAHELALLLLGGWLAVRHERMLFVFGILVAPVLCRLVCLVAAKKKAIADHWQVNFVAIAAAALVVVYSFPTPAQIQKEIDDANPWEALLYVRRAGLSGRMLNDYNFGGYLIWAAPERKVFIDGRADMYEPAGVLADYESWIHLRDTKTILDKYQIEFCLFGREASAAQILAKTPGWKQVYGDRKAVVIVRQKLTS